MSIVTRMIRSIGLVAVSQPEISKTKIGSSHQRSDVRSLKLARFNASSWSLLNVAEGLELLEMSLGIRFAAIPRTDLR